MENIIYYIIKQKVIRFHRLHIGQKIVKFAGKDGGFGMGFCGVKNLIAEMKDSLFIILGNYLRLRKNKITVLKPNVFFS